MESDSNASVSASYRVKREKQRLPEPIDRWCRIKDCGIRSLNDMGHIPRSDRRRAVRQPARALHQCRTRICLALMSVRSASTGIYPPEAYICYDIKREVLGCVRNV